MRRMSFASNVPTSPLPDDTGFLTAFMPNRGRARFLRGAILLFLGIGALGAVAVGARVFWEFYSRQSWPVAPGMVTGREVRSNKGLPGNTSRATSYWVEYEVRFSVPAGQCLTGTISADTTDPMPCWGTVSTRATESWATANAWMLRHPVNSVVGVLHAPNGPGVKIVGEPVWLVYPWKDIFIILAWLAFFLTFFRLAQRRLRYLETLPEDYDATPPSSREPCDPDEPIDLKLS